MTPESSPVISPHLQTKIISSTKTAERYLSLHHVLFGKGSANHFNYASNQSSFDSSSPNIWNMFSLIAIEASKAGFSSFYNGFDRHNNVHHFKRQFLSLPHQTALLEYLTSLNNKAAPFRKQWRKTVRPINPKAALGLQATGFFVRAGEIHPIHSDDLEELEYVGERRFERGVPIFLPNPSLEIAFSNLGLSSQEAEVITREDFIRKHQPALEKAAKGLFDAKSLIGEFGLSSFIP